MLESGNSFPRVRKGEPNMAQDLLKRITVNPNIFAGKPIIRGRRLGVEHVLGMLAEGDSAEDILANYPWLEREDLLACLTFAHKLLRHERFELLFQSGVQ